MHLTYPTSLMLLLPALAWVVWTAQRTLIQQSAGTFRLTLLLRCICLCTVIFAIADPQFRHSSHRRQIVIAVDSSISVQPQADRVGTTFAGQLQSRSGEEVQVYIPEEADSESAQKSDLEALIVAAAQEFDAGTVSHLILVSDGVETTGNAVAVAGKSAFPISVIPTAPFQTGEYGITSIETSNELTGLREGETISVKMRWYASEACSLRINLFANSNRIFGDTLRTEAGFSEKEIQCTVPSGKLLQLDADVYAETADRWPENNHMTRVISVRARPRVLLVSANADHVRELENSLIAQSIDVDVRRPDAIPGDIQGLAEFDAVILSNIAIAQLPDSFPEHLRQYVSELGGGLVVCGGDRSFSAGGYAQSLFETILPVSSQITENADDPSRAVVLLIDKSSSMSGEKIEMAQASAVSLLNHLGRSDELGVIAFDAQPHEVSALRTVTDSGAIRDEILTITPNGGTTLEPAIAAAGQMLKQSQASQRQIILLTDGATTDSDPEAAVRLLSEQGISFSAISIGEDAQTNLLDTLAAAGRGRSWHATVPSQIPELVLQETDGRTGSVIREEPVDVQINMAAKVLRSPEFRTYPPLLGYVQTSPKPGSDLILTTQDGRPLLSWWQYGTGTVAAFTSDASGRWTSEWTTWSAFPQFWSQIVRHTMKNANTETVTVRAIRRNDQTDVIIETESPAPEEQKILEAGLTIIDPRSNISTQPLQPNTADRFVYRLRTQTPGPWLFEAWIRMADGLERSQPTIVVQDSYPELRPQPVSDNTLRQIAEVSGGLFNPSADDVLRMSQPPVDRFESLREELLCLACLLWVCDIVARKLRGRGRLA